MQNGLAVNLDLYKSLKNEFQKNVELVAVSKTQSPAKIMELYNEGHRDFGENYVQELVEKYEALPKDIRWHFIGHLQSNKTKYIAPFIHLVQSVDSEKLLKEIDKQGKKVNRSIDCLLQVHISGEETKFGFDEEELHKLLGKVDLNTIYPNVRICGLMGMASFTDDEVKVKKEFASLQGLFAKHAGESDHFNILSMGMSADYMIALECGSNMVRIGSSLFGERSSA